MNRFRLFSLTTLSFVLLSIFVFSVFNSPVNSKTPKRQEFIIESGQSLDSITKNLKNQNLVRSSSVTKVLIFLKRYNKKIQAGYFYLSPSSTLSQIVESLTHASAKQIWITLPEGLRRQEIASITLSALKKENQDTQFNASEFISLTKNKEGYLFPETYALKPDITTQEVIDKLTSQFESITKDLNISSQNLDKILILASLLERETQSSEEMSTVAGILLKRLENNWPLQVDATIQFAKANQVCRSFDCQWWPTPLTSADLKIISPYNTYANQGLPPLPISNPGRQALFAAQNPNLSPYWFFLHDSKGQIHYAKTIEEHNQNICQFLKKDC